MSKTQRWAGVNVIQFMAVLLVLTIVARGASGATLARVYTTFPSRGEIIQEVSGTAVVSSTDTLDIFAPEGLVITEMLASVGQTVQVGDAVARFNIREINIKLIRETAVLEKMLLDMEILERSDSVDSFNVDNNQRSLARAYEDFNSTKRRGEADVAAAQAALNEALNALAEAEAAGRSSPGAVNRSAPDKADQIYSDVTDFSNTSAVDDSDLVASSSYDWDAVDNSNNGEADNSNQGAVSVSDQVKTDNTNPGVEGNSDPGAADNTAPDMLKELQAAVDRARDLLESAQRRAQDDLLNATRRIEDAQAGLSAARQDYERNQGRHSETVESNRISATTLQLEIEEQHEVIRKLRTLMDNEGTIYSEKTGVVSAVKSSGDTIGKDALITLKDGEKGFEATMLLNKEDSDKLTIGSECEVSTGSGTMFFMPTVPGTVTAISQPDEDDMVKVTIWLSQWDWAEGQRVDVYAVLDGSIHEMCVPLSALRSDNTGYFVLLTEQRSTVLGVENIVDRVPVYVMASDRDKVSIQGPIGRNSQIITGSSKPVAEGDRVRVG